MGYRPPRALEMNGGHSAAANSPEKIEHWSQAGDDFRNGFSHGFWTPEAAPGRPPENRPFIWRVCTTALTALLGMGTMSLNHCASRFLILRQSQ
jgi:hypothetical protein